MIPSITAWRRRRSPGENGFYLISSEPFGLIVLDVMLPGRSGLEIPSTARFRGLRTPVLIVTARDAVEDRAVRLDSGPDDYLVKPLAFPELQARVRVLLRRGKNEPVTKLRSGGLEMDLVGRTEVQDGQTLDLTAREFELLEYLIRNHGRVVTREMLARDVWKENAPPTPLYNVIERAHCTITAENRRPVSEETCSDRSWSGPGASQNHGPRYLYDLERQLLLRGNESSR